MKKTKTKKTSKKKNLKPTPKYIGGPLELYFPDYEQQLVRIGDLVPEMPIEEARARNDFVIVNER
jgi:hypothetical protein